MSRLVTTRVLSEILSIPMTSIRKLRRDGKIKWYKIDGKNYLFDPEEVIQTIKNNSLQEADITSTMPSTVTDTHKEGN